MIDFAHEEMLLLLALLAFGDVLNGAAQANGPSLGPDTLEIRKPMTLDPADLSVSPPHPILMDVRLRIGRVERSFAVSRGTCRIVGVVRIDESLVRFFVRNN